MSMAPPAHYTDGASTLSPRPKPQAALHRIGEELESSQERLAAAQARRFLGAVIAPSTLITALALYSGWARTNAVAAYFGLDSSLLGFSAQDYLLRSADVLFIPLGALLLAALLLVSAHLWVADHVPDNGRVMRWLPVVLLVVGFGLFTLGAADAVSALSFWTPFLFPQLSPGLGAILLSYGLFLRRRRQASLEATDTPSPPQKTPSPRREARSPHHFLWLLTLGVAGMLVVLSLFWGTPRVPVGDGTTLRG